MNEKKDSKDAKKPMTVSRKQQQKRRDFFRSVGLLTGVVGISLLGAAPVLQGKTIRLRPPGALKTPDDEKDFFALCIKCGKCVQVCPVEAIKLADLLDGFGVGVPYIDAREQACDFSCDGLQCVLACPTGALTHDLNYPADSRMGFASPARSSRSRIACRAGADIVFVPGKRLKCRMPPRRSRVLPAPRGSGSRPSRAHPPL